MATLFNHSNFTKPFKWLVLALCIKVIFYFLFLFTDTNPRRHWADCFLLSADHNEYVRPMDNFFAKGSYAMDGQKEAYAGRMPGFVFPYMIFRAVFNEHVSAVLLGIFILSLSILASYVLALLMYRMVQKRWAFISAFFLLNCIPYFWHYDWTLHTNSLGVSSTIFFLHYYYQYRTADSKKSLVIAGFFLAWIIMLRGFTLVFIPVVLLSLVYFLWKNRSGFKKIVVDVFIIALPFVVFESAWITRNYLSLHKFIPFQTSFVPGSNSKNPEYNTNIITKHSMMSVRKLIFAWGGDNTWYFNNADMAWFVKRKDPLINEFRFDDNIFFEGFTIDSLNQLKSSILFSFENNLKKESQDSIEMVIENTAERYYKNFSEHKRGYMYTVAQFKRLKNYLFKNATQDWPGPKYTESNILQKGFKLLSLAEYAVLLLCVILFPVAYSRNKNNPDKRYFGFCYLLILANMLPFMGLINFAHYSYFIFGYCLLIPVFIFIIDTFKSSVKNG